MRRIIVFIISLICISQANIAMATTDGVSYEVINGYKITNLWIQDRKHTPYLWSEMPYCNTYARSAVLYDGYIYIARSNAKEINVGNEVLSQSVIYKIDASDGSFVGEIPLTLNGNIYGGTTLSSNTVGVDDFGHLYIAPFSSVLDSTQSVYLVDKETGELTLMGVLNKGDILYRCDHIDVIGDITREMAECNIMTAGASSECVHRWHADKDGNWEGGFGGNPFLDFVEFYPENAGWGWVPIVKMIHDSDGNYSGNLFYIDGYYSSPALYDVTGKMLQNFKDVDPSCCPIDVGANGFCEFTLDGRTFLAYVVAQYNGIEEVSGFNRACQVYISELGENRDFSGMHRYWMVPDELGTMSDGGTRVQCINVEYGVDSNGNEEVTLFIYKCYNGMAVYKISKCDIDSYFEVNGIYYSKIGEDEAKVISKLDGGSYEGDIIIPSNVTYQGNNYVVKEIDSYAFAGDKSLLSIELPSTVDRIGDYAFYECTRLRSMVLLGGVDFIGSNAFKGANIYSLFLGTSVTSINNIGLNPSEIYTYASIPPSCDENSFKSYYGTLHVPAASLAAYFTADYWSNFANIIADAVEPSLAINQDSVNMKIGTEYQLIATITPSNAAPNYVNWRSSNPNIVSVSSNGMITALSTGVCDIIATCGYKKAFCHVVVRDTTSSIILDVQEAMLLPNHMLTITPSAAPVMPEGFTVSSSNPGIAAARLVNGVVQIVGIKEGTTIITVGSVDDSAIPATCVVTVYTEPGDVNCDGFINISDVTKLIDYLLSGNPEGLKVDNADTNRDGKVNISDVTTLIDYLLSGRWPEVIPPDNHEYVDLGLPSGTLWATMNIGANSPEDFGDYFAWGETAPKESFDMSSYKWCNGTWNTMTKYCTDTNTGYNGFTDGKTELDPEDDAVYVNWGPSWRMPTWEQQEELMYNCTWEWAQVNGVNGQLVTGSNGNSIFLPAAGFRWYDHFTNASSWGYYYSRTLDPDMSSNACGMCFDSDLVNWNSTGRHCGQSVRAVRVSQN